jgi:hypothetical protein
MTRAELETLVTERCVECWRGLVKRDLARGGDGRLRQTAIALTDERMLVTLHTDYPDDERRMSAAFRLPEPLPPDEDIERGEIVGDWQRCNGGFLVRLHAWLEDRQTLH